MRRLRVAFLPLLPVTNAATRTFCERPIEHLAHRGVTARLFPPSGPFAYRLLVRAGSRIRVPLAAVYWYGVVAPRRLVQIVRALRYDVLFIQRGLFRYRSPPVLEGLLKFVAGRLLGRTIVYHCDDALYTVVRPSYYRARFRWADVVVTGNAEIAATVRESNPRIEVFDGAVDTRRYPVKRHRSGDVVVLGWVGHAADEHLEPIGSALARVCRSRPVRLKVVSDARPRRLGLGEAMEFERWTIPRAFELFAEFDVGLMPLQDTPYNRGKEAFKAKEYMAAGLPVVCSPVGHSPNVVEHGVTGFFATTDDQWVTAIERLCDDPALRAKLGAAGRRVVMERYELSVQAERVADLLLAVHERGRGAAARVGVSQ